MKTFIQFITEDQLLEKLIIVGGGAQYGQIVFLAGGAGSGKGFAVQNFIEGNKFKIRDVDAWKAAFLRLEHEFSKIAHLPACEIDPTTKRPIRTGHCNPYGAIHGLDLRNPKDVFALHDFVDGLGIKDATLNYMLDHAQSGHLPNILFDITAKKMKTLTEYIPKLLEVGYEAKDIHLIWVLTDYRIAVQRNAQRSRVVPEDIMLQTHEGAAKTVYSILQGDVPHGLDGGIYVILNNTENTIFHPGSKSVVKDFKYLKVKDAGHPLEPEDAIKKEVYGWITANIPKSELTADIFEKPL
jgi:hypothetical protein